MYCARNTYTLIYTHNAHARKLPNYKNNEKIVKKDIDTIITGW